MTRKGTYIRECREAARAFCENSYFDQYRQKPPMRQEATPEPQMEEPMDNEPEMTHTPENSQEGDVLANIRKSIIKGLGAYADNIDSPTYQTLKKLFAIIDKREEEPATDNGMNQ